MAGSLGQKAALSDSNALREAPAKGSFSFDAYRCTKCHACEVACAVWHDADPPAGGFRRIDEEESGSYPNVTRTFKLVTLPGCDRCASAGCSPRCALTCPTGALRFE